MTISDSDGQLLALQCQQFIIDRVPQELIEKFEVHWVEKDFKVEVRLKREPTKEELEHLNEVIVGGLEEFRQKTA